MVAIGAPQTKAEGGPSMVFTGSGFCVDPRGIIVTCGHVLNPLAVAQAKGQVVASNAELGTDPTGAQPSIQIVGLPLHAIFFYEKDNDYWGTAVPGGPSIFHPTFDIGVFRLQDPHFDGPASPYPSVALGDSSTLVEGETVAACGFPFGHEFEEIAGSVNSTLSVGIVSAILPAPPAIRGRKFVRFQMDMTVNSGNSGGPVFRPDTGEVVGLVSESLMHKDAGPSFRIGFAVPINLVKPAIERVLTVAQPKSS